MYAYLFFFPFAGAGHAQASHPGHFGPNSFSKPPRTNNAPKNNLQSSAGHFQAQSNNKAPNTTLSPTQHFLHIPSIQIIPPL